MRRGAFSPEWKRSVTGRQSLPAPLAAEPRRPKRAGWAGGAASIGVKVCRATVSLRRYRSGNASYGNLV